MFAWKRKTKGATKKNHWNLKIEQSHVKLRTFWQQSSISVPNTTIQMMQNHFSTSDRFTSRRNESEEDENLIKAHAKNYITWMNVQKRRVLCVVHGGCGCWMRAASNLTQNFLLYYPHSSVENKREKNHFCFFFLFFFFIFVHLVNLPSA